METDKRASHRRVMTDWTVLSQAEIRIDDLHADVDNEARALVSRLGSRITCHRGCLDCCVDGLTVFEVEAERIRRDAGTNLTGAVPHPAGACVFLDPSGACRIYDSRPYVCRTQGLPLRWIEEDEAGAAVEYRDICPRNDAGTPIESLGDADCWTIGPVEARLVQIQRARGEASASRVALRTLFGELSGSGLT
ncbi:MAG: YkgJ family cysteine cluster protein [Acidobacteria bacterium]|nr:YkgJ family cysteine cluster protein [Acidobacteriota bacterium]